MPQTCLLGAQAASPAPSRARIAFAGILGRRSGAWPPFGFLLRIKEPLTLQIEKDDDGSFIVSDILFGVYGEGTELDAAFEDYRSALMDYVLLLRDRSKISPEDALLYRSVNRYVEVGSPNPYSAPRWDLFR